MLESTYALAVDRQAELNPDRVAFGNSSGERITYAELKLRSDALAMWLDACDRIPAAAPLIVYGHKSPLMLVCFFAAVKSGHAYVPVDTVYPFERVANIAGQIGATAVLDTTGTCGFDEAKLGCAVVDVPTAMQGLADAPAPDAASLAALPTLGALDTYYVLFTSGSTGTPKGVQVPRDALDNFNAWVGATVAAKPEGAPARVWFNRAAFSFDLSLTDLVCGLAQGDTLFALDSAAEASLAETFAALSASGVTDWVSTPSFVGQCLADPSFNRELLPRLERILVVGETLPPATVRHAKERFDGLVFINGYGPTESTDFIAYTEIDDTMLVDDTPLPIGRVKPNMDLFVLDPQTLEEVPVGTPGELFIAGDTVATGYWGRPEQTEAAFRSCPEHLARGRRSYRTGDEVTLDETGMLHFHGRLDLQIKLHGFRIELGDIESTLAALPQVRAAAVLPVVRDGAVSRLTAFVVPADPQAPRGFALTRELKAAAREKLPDYMIPSAFKYIDDMPLNQNGKADRKALAALLGA